MTDLLDTTDSIEPASATSEKSRRDGRPAITLGRSKRKAAPDPGAAVARAKSTIEKLEEQNHKAASVLQDMTSLWLSADAKRRRGEAEMALNHFDAALIALRKSLAAT